MDAVQDPSSILFYLRSGKDISPLISQTESPSEVGSKKSSLDCKQMIVSAFAPQVPISCSDEVDKIAEGFGFHSFFQLFKPFGDKIQNKFQIKDSQLISRTADNFSLKFTRPLDHLLSIQDAQKGTANQLLNQQSLEILMEEYIRNVNDEILKLTDTPEDKITGSLLRSSIYSKYFSKFISNSNITAFEYMNHPISSFLIISANETYEQARTLLIQFKNTKIPEFLSMDDILPIFIIIHDEKDDEEHQKAFQLKDQIKKQLYIDGFVLPFSLNKELPSTRLKPPLLLLSVEEELQEIKFSNKEQPVLPNSNCIYISTLLKEIIQKKIIPFMEQKIATWDEQVITPRKSITGRLFKVSKRYFGGGSTKNQATNEKHSNFNVEKGYYINQSTEAITRKLADWSFMLRDYKYAYTTYEISKKDFLSDKAWNYLASTQEMAAISLLMGATNITSKLKNDTIDPLLDSANYTYLARCGLKTYALRSILIVSELFCTLRDGWESSPAALKWVQKALDDKIVGKVGKSLLYQRISYIYTLYVSSQAKIIMSRKLIKDTPENTQEEPQHTHELFNKLATPHMATIGLTRKRKAALWSLLAAKDWDPQLHPLEVKLCLESTNPIYNEDISFVKNPNGLYQKLLNTSIQTLKVVE